MTAPAPGDENENVSEDVNISETGSLKKTMRIAYRVTPVEYQTMTRIADLLFKNGSIKINSPSELARAAAFTQINIFLHIEAKLARNMRRNYINAESSLHAAIITYPHLAVIDA